MKIALIFKSVYNKEYAINDQMFIDAHDENGKSINVGEWAADGEYESLTIDTDQFKQSRLHSWFEACLNTATGFCISYAFTVLYMHAVDAKVTSGQNLTLVGVLTIVSVVRSYVWRRIFNRG